MLGGAERARTADIRLAKAALSQLSYSPDINPESLLICKIRWWA